MRRSTVAAAVASSAVAAVVAAGVVAGPALAGTTAPASQSTSPTSTAGSTERASTFSGLTDSEQAELDEFLQAHPRVAQALVVRIERWKSFSAANPGVVAELKKVAALPADQRKAELKAWGKSHPDELSAWHEFRQQVREDRGQRRQERRAQR